MANSKLEFVKAESLKLRKDLIAAMDETNKVNEKIKELNEALCVEKMLVIQKDEKIQAALLRTSAEREKVDDKHHSLAVDFSNLDFEKIDTKILVDEAKEQEEIEVDVAGGKDATITDRDQGDKATMPPS
nr:hypothetical protein CFP56_32532 [Quercus suber]